MGDKDMIVNEISLVIQNNKYKILMNHESPLQTISLLMLFSYGLETSERLMIIFLMRESQADTKNLTSSSKNRICAWLLMTIFLLNDSSSSLSLVSSPMSLLVFL